MAKALRLARGESNGEDEVEGVREERRNKRVGRGVGERRVDSVSVYEIMGAVDGASIEMPGEGEEGPLGENGDAAGTTLMACGGRESEDTEEAEDKDEREGEPEEDEEDADEVEETGPMVGVEGEDDEAEEEVEDEEEADVEEDKGAPEGGRGTRSSCSTRGHALNSASNPPTYSSSTSICSCERDGEAASNGRGAETAADEGERNCVEAERSVRTEGGASC